MAIATFFDLDIFQFDAVNAFLNAKLDEEVFVRNPDGFGDSNTCLRLVRALYGLRRSPLLWLNDLSATLEALGLRPVPEAQCLFKSKHLIVFFYVDDICVLCHPSDRQYYHEFRTKIMRIYELREIPYFKWFLGIRIVRDRTARKMWLCQDSYIEKIATSFNLTQSVPPKTPMIMDELTPYEGQATSQEIFAYQQRVGSINYPAVTCRPDVSRTAQKLSEFLINPGYIHLAAADRAISYLYGTRTRSIEYNSLMLEALFQGSSDSAYADNSLTRRSTEGYLFMLFGGPIDWRSTKQSTVTTSTTEAELLALSHSAGQLYWWQRFFKDIELDLKQDYQLYCDNLQTVRLMLKETPKLVTKLKHVDIHNLWLRQEVQRTNLKIEWICTADMKADGFTKALPKEKHREFVRQLNLVDIKLE